MKKLILTVAVFGGFSFMVKAQSISPDVLASSGDFFSNAAGSVSWTLGEPMGETYSSANNFITQGFQQPWDFGTGVVSTQPVKADAFPNPATDAVFVQFGADASGMYTIETFNALGQRLDGVQFNAAPSARAHVDMSAYADGIYFITVRKADGSQSTTFKITKNS